MEKTVEQFIAEVTTRRGPQSNFFWAVEFVHEKGGSCNLTFLVLTRHPREWTFESPGVYCPRCRQTPGVTLVALHQFTPDNSAWTF